MEWERQRTYDYENGKEAGAQEKAEEAARSFYANGVSIELIAKSLHMTEEEVREIVNEPVKVNAWPGISNLSRLILNKAIELQKQIFA